MVKKVMNALYYGKYLADAPDIIQAIMIDGITIKLEFSNVYDKLETFGVSAEKLPFVVEDQAGINRINAYRTYHASIPINL